MTERQSSPARLARLHAATDQRFMGTVSALPQQIGCSSGCCSCCVDELTVWEPEAARISAHVAKAQLNIDVGPEGGCAFLLNGRCQVYEARPYVCRSQGAVLRYWDDEGEVRQTCTEHLREVDLATLPAAALFDLGVAEQELASIASAHLGEKGGRGLPGRVFLRDLAHELANQSG